MVRLQKRGYFAFIWRREPNDIPKDVWAHPDLWKLWIQDALNNPEKIEVRNKYSSDRILEKKKEQRNPLREKGQQPRVRKKILEAIKEDLES